MRIGTWNLAGRWGKPQHQLLQQQDCDVWLLTEVRADVTVQGYHRHLTTAHMTEGRHWAGVYSRSPLQALPDPHPASAAARVHETTFCSTVLPWRSAGRDAPWDGANHGDKMAAALNSLRQNLPGDGTLVWGGDFNQALLGPESAGSWSGREHLLAALEHFRLQAPTAGLRHRLDGHATIDHIAVPADHQVTGVERISASALSDHDAYLVHSSN